MKALVLAAALAAISTASHAATLWDNGAASVNGFWCSSDEPTCGGPGWVIYDDFNLAVSANVSGFGYDTIFSSGGPGSYTGTEWSIWSSDPRTNYGSGPAFNGTAVGSLAADGEFERVTVSSLSLDLTAGTYWLGFSNTVNNNDVTLDAEVSVQRLGTASQSDTTGNFYNPNINDQAFSIYGTDQGSATPEPAAWALMIMGFGAAGAMLRRRRVQVA